MNNNIFSVIDLGTNNIQLLIVQDRDDPKIILKDSKVSELGKNFKDGLIANDRLDFAKRILSNFISLSKEYTNNILVIGTNLARKATNISEIEKFLSDLGIKFIIISGEEEAYLNGIANIKDFKGNFILFDIGGGSTEFTVIENETITKTVSLPLGIRSLDEKFCNIEQKNLFTKQILKSLDLESSNHYLVGIGGTVTSLLFLKNNLTEYNFINIHKSQLTQKDIIRIYDDFVTIHIEKYKNSPIFKMFSLELLATGTMIVKNILELFNVKSFYISDKSIMFGVLYDKKYKF